MKSDVLEHIHITIEEVLAVLRHIKMNKSPGPDQVQVYTKTLWKETTGILVEIFAPSLATGEML